MKKKSFIKREMEKQMPQKQADDLWQAATEKLDDILSRYADLPKGVHMHTDINIFPAAAVYLAAREKVGDASAYSIIENAAVSLTSRLGKQLSRMMHIPGMPSLFLAVWDPMTHKMFGPGNGFKNVFYPKKAGEYRMDVTACPYCCYFTELGCPELTRIYCENDERIYGNLPGVVFERTGTLGKGAERCDFCIRKA